MMGFLRCRGGGWRMEDGGWREGQPPFFVGEGGMEDRGWRGAILLFCWWAQQGHSGAAALVHFQATRLAIGVDSRHQKGCQECQGNPKSKTQNRKCATG